MVVGVVGVLAVVAIWGCVADVLVSAVDVFVVDVFASVVVVTGALLAGGSDAATGLDATEERGSA